YDVKNLKKISKTYSGKFLINPLFCALISNISILLLVIGIGFYAGIISSLNYKKLYGDHCSVDSDCETGLNLRCQNGNCNCTTTTFYNQSLMVCASKKLNAIPCSNDQECCCEQKCAYDSAKKMNVCSCTTDRWWNANNSSCQKKSFFNEACSSSDQCVLETNLVCLSNKCVCSDASLNFWNGTFCDTVQSFMGKCRISQGCNPAQGLICNITEQHPYKCTCAPYNYWNSTLSSCKTQKTNNDPCGATNECKSDTGLYCDSVCKCLNNYFWSTDKCSIIFL
ncbi:prion-like-(Q N-rich) domain-bearing 25, partial [Brachionus plicatilis]